MRIDRTHTWVYTCVTPSFFELTLRWLPEKPWDILRHMLVITKVGDPKLKCDLETLAGKMRPRWPITVVDDAVLRELALSYPAPLQRYTEVSLGVKIILPLWVPTPFFFTDDDVIVVSDPGVCLVEETLWGSHSGLDTYSEVERDARELQAWQEVIDDPHMTRAEFNRSRTDAAVWHFPELDREAYHKALYRFFDKPVAYDVAESGGNRFRLFDQRFLTMWLYANSGDVYGAPLYRAWATRKLPKSVPADAMFIHYCASSQKPRYVEWLHQVADERGIPR